LDRAVIEANIKKRVHRKTSAAEQARLKEIEAFEFDGKDGWPEANETGSATRCSTLGFKNMFRGWRLH